jgi:nitrous oxidase accessory protein
MQKNKRLVGLFSLLLIFSLFLTTFNIELVKAAGKDIYVDDDQKYPDEADGSLYNPFYSIQDAIDASQNGDTIKILPGDYKGSIVVDKSITITTEDMINTYILSNEKRAYVIDITAPYVSLEMLSIQDFTNTSHRKAIIHISSGADDTKIINNWINHSINGYGISIEGANSVIISNNSINDTRGINVRDSNLLTIDSNYVSNCSEFPALRLVSANENHIGENIFENGHYGIYSDDCNDNSIFNNIITKNFNSGILMQGYNNYIINNTIFDNGNTGIDLRSINNIISENTIYDNIIGISISKTGNIIKDNTLYNGGSFNIYARSGSNNNNIYNNNFTKKIGSHVLEEGKNQWDNNGIGNFWSDFFGPDPKNENNTVAYDSVNVPNVYKYRKGGLTDNYPKGRYHEQPEITIDTEDVISPSPVNLEEGVSRSPRLSVIVTDPDPLPYTERLDVKFYYILENVSNLIDVDKNVESGGTASVWFSSTIKGKNAVYSYNTKYTS